MQQAWKMRDRRAVAELVSDRMVDQVCVFGPPSQCREQLDAFQFADGGVEVVGEGEVDGDQGLRGIRADLAQFIGFHPGVRAAAADHDVSSSHRRAQGFDVQRPAAARSHEAFGPAGR